MMCVTPTIVAAVMLCLTGCCLSVPANSCGTVKSGLSFVQAVYIDGVLVPNGTSQDFTISSQSSVLAVQIASGPGHFAQVNSKLPTSSYVCTTTNPSNSKWTSVSFDDSAWPYTSNVHSPSINQIVQKNDLYCRFYLACKGAAATTTTTTTKASNTPTTKAPTTPATTATTTQGSSLPIVQGTSGGGNFQAGQPAILQCTFGAVNRPTTVTWFLNGAQLIDSNSNMAVQSDGSLLATYTISAVGAPNAGQYTCQGSNVNGAGAFGPAVTVAVNGNYVTSVLDGIMNLAIVKQLDGTFNQQVLLQASQGCAGLQIQFQADSAIDSSYGDYAYFDGNVVQVYDTSSSTWPSDCNNQNVWIWIQISSSGYSVGTGPVIGQNVAVSTTTLTGIADTFLEVANFGSSVQTVYLY